MILTCSILILPIATLAMPTQSYLVFFALIAMATEVNGGESAAAVSRRCDFPVVDGAKLTPASFQKMYVESKTPIVLLNAGDCTAARMWRWNTLSDILQGMQLRVGNGPVPKDSMSIDDYLKLTKAEGKEEVPGVFQYGQVPTSWSLWAHKDKCFPYVSHFDSNSIPIHSNVSLTCKLLAENVRVPGFLVGHTNLETPPNMITHAAFLIGHSGSGIDFHKHQTAINTVFEGQKEWFMKVRRKVVDKFSSIPSLSHTPRTEMYCARNPSQRICAEHGKQQGVIEKSGTRAGGRSVKFHKADTHMGTFASMIKTSQQTEELEETSELMHCLQKPGEIIFIPEETQHAVRNVGNTVGMQMQWKSNHFDSQEERTNFYRKLLNDMDSREPNPVLLQQKSIVKMHAEVELRRLSRAKRKHSTTQQLRSPHLRSP